MNDVQITSTGTTSGHSSCLLCRHLLCLYQRWKFLVRHTEFKYLYSLQYFFFKSTINSYIVLRVEWDPSVSSETLLRFKFVSGHSDRKPVYSPLPPHPLSFDLVVHGGSLPFLLVHKFLDFIRWHRYHLTYVLLRPLHPVYCVLKRWFSSYT